MKNFYLLFPCAEGFTQQLVEQFDKVENLICHKLWTELVVP